MTEQQMSAGCDCTELCSMGPTCPGGMLAGLPDSGCWRTTDLPAPVSSGEAGVRRRALDEYEALGRQVCVHANRRSRCRTCGPAYRAAHPLRPAPVVTPSELVCTVCSGPVEPEQVRPEGDNSPLWCGDCYLEGRVPVDGVAPPSAEGSQT